MAKGRKSSKPKVVAAASAPSPAWLVMMTKVKQENKSRPDYCGLCVKTDESHMHGDTLWQGGRELF